ncbi:hypothetical protein SteCoe_22437 [Stentor coeruleus]|uniref:non-specific serine/threonine protein kinase n=1 Tax=Stentor coeruleus TaxID=5963 RepID=A0A1R2BMB9_9CILI|nr:hypothetical protein SteCoe_22437 [Stentor coeruleus]
MGMKNHEIVPLALIENIAKLRRGGVFKVVQSLLKKKLIAHINKQVDGYSLTYSGYDVLAIHTFIKRGLIKQIGNMLGTGKESDIYLCKGPNDEDFVLKLARLGRTSFRAVKTKRDYLKGRSKHNWLYLSRLSAIKEYTFMESLYKTQIPTPQPISHNRHAILMSLIQGYPLINVSSIKHPGKVLNDCVNLSIKLVELGLVHCDFNQFNLLVTDDEDVFVIDFPQMVSVDHFNGEELYEKDIVCLNEFFANRFGVFCENIPKLKDLKVLRHVDAEIKASGYLKENLKDYEIEELDQVIESAKREDDDEEMDSGSGEEPAEELKEEEEKEKEKGVEETKELNIINSESLEEKIPHEDQEDSENSSDESGSQDEDLNANPQITDQNKTKTKTKAEKTPENSSDLKQKISNKLKKNRQKREKVRTNRNKVKGQMSLNF